MGNDLRGQQLGHHFPKVKEGLGRCTKIGVLFSDSVGTPATEQVSEAQGANRPRVAVLVKASKTDLSVVQIIGNPP